MWKCPPLNLFNWSNYWKWKNDMRDELDMTFTVTVTYTVPAYGRTKLDCMSMVENMSIEDIQKEGTMQEIDIGDGEVI